MPFRRQVHRREFSTRSVAALRLFCRLHQVLFGELADQLQDAPVRRSGIDPKFVLQETADLSQRKPRLSPCQIRMPVRLRL